MSIEKSALKRDALSRALKSLETLPFQTKEEVDELREKLKKAGVPILSIKEIANGMGNSRRSRRGFLL